MLSIAAGAGALVVAAWAGAALRGVISTVTPGGAPPPASVADPRTLLVTLALTVVTAMMTAVVPVFLAGRRDLSGTLRGGVRGGIAEGTRLRVGLLVCQASLSVVLLVGALLFVRSLHSAQSLPLGYDADRVLLVLRTIRGVPLEEATHRTTRQILESTAHSIPGVASAAWVSSTPFLSTSSSTLHLDGSGARGPFSGVAFQATTAEYFQTMGTRILRGRGLTADDRAGAPPVAIVSESLAGQLWPGADPIGRCFRMREPTAPCSTVVGVAEDIVQRDLAGPERAHFYVSIDQVPRGRGGTG